MFFKGMRYNVMRIPEVIHRVKEFEKEINRHFSHQTPVDLLFVLQKTYHQKMQTKNLFCSGQPGVGWETLENSYTKQTALKYRCLYIAGVAIQLGLYDRFVKTQSFDIKYLAALSSSQETLFSCLDKTQTAQLVQSLLESFPISVGQEKVHVWTRGSSAHHEMPSLGVLNFVEMLNSWYITGQCQNIIFLGPGQYVFSEHFDRRIKQYESIALDAQLSWFWSDIKHEVFSPNPGMAV